MASSSSTSNTVPQLVLTATDESALLSRRSSPIPPVLCTYVLTQSDYESDLMCEIDELIRHFLIRCNRQHPYHKEFRRTIDCFHHNKYNIVLTIDRSADP